MTATTATDLRRRLDRNARKIDDAPRAHRPHLEALIVSLGQMLDDLTTRTQDRWDRPGANAGARCPEVVAVLDVPGAEA